ncbi:GntR family transcriptional regulator [Spirochaetia bacterium]|nr:GntR family transcriptional regulator [Spirochaetia bacterium]
MMTDYFKKTFKFSPHSDLPLYSQLEGYMKMQIQAGFLKPGDKMITEIELCEILNVSRTTVRLAMNSLVNEGLIIRRRGKGSFIGEQKLRRKIDYMYNFSENIQNMGAAPSSIVLESKIIRADAIVAGKLQLPEENLQVFFLQRVRCANDVPILLESTYIPYFLCKGIEKADFKSASLYSLLSNSYSINPYHAVEVIEAIILDLKTAKILDCKSKMPGYKIERVSYLNSEYVFEYTTSVTRADKCVFRLDLYRNNNSNKNSIDFERQLNT